jgi:prepilin-type N-terminal cleavage/methylation domain-containing protein
MLPKLREHSQSEDGFSLIEVLVVILIVSLLAAIAIAVFTDQRSKGEDVEAKASAATAARALEVCANENGGRYDMPGSLCDRSKLVDVEPTLSGLGTRLEEPVLGADTYSVTVQSARAPSEVKFTMIRRSNGEVDRVCAVGTKGKGGCRSPGGPGQDW